jgi:hypothetical protein
MRGMRPQYEGKTLEGMQRGDKGKHEGKVAFESTGNDTLSTVQHAVDWFLK